MQLNREKLFIPLSIAVISLAFIVIGSLLANLILAVKNHQNAPKENEPKNDHLIMTENHSTDHSNVMENEETATKEGITTKYEKITEHSTTKPKTRKICKTPECFRISAQLQSWRDDRVNPCDDFYKYSCGRYVEMEDTVQGLVEQKTVTVMATLREYFLTSSPSTSSKSEQTIKNLFSKCKQQNGNKSAQMENVIDFVLDIQKIGSFPIFDKNWKESSFDLNQILENMAKTHISKFGLFGVQVASNKVTLTPDLLEYKNKPEWFKNIILTFLMARYQSVTEQDKNRVNTDFDNAEVLRTTISAVSKQKINDESKKFTNFSNLTQKITKIDFERVLKTMIRPKNGNLEKLKTVLRVTDHPLFFDDLNNIEKIIENAPKRDLANFLIIQFIRQIELFHNGDCLETVVNGLPKAALQIFVTNFFKKENLNTTSNLVEELKSSFIEKFQKSTWLDEKTRKNAIQKIEKMQSIIGYPEEFEAPGALDAIYEEMLDIHSNDSFYAMSRKVLRFHSEQYMNYAIFGEVLRPVYNLLKVNAQYKPTQNFLMIFLAFMDEPFLDPSFPLIVTIANAGNILGHEIGHGFDNNGRLRDEKGEENDWWTSENAQEYERRVGCLRKQFDDYDDRVYGKKLNNDTVIGEIIADTLGHDISWMTYSKMNSSTESVGIVGLEDVPDDQLFFQMSSMVWCGHRSQVPLARAQTLVHPPGVFRVNGALSNMKSFAETFNCPVGSPMNPKDKCEIF